MSAQSEEGIAYLDNTLANQTDTADPTSTTADTATRPPADSAPTAQSSNNPPTAPTSTNAQDSVQFESNDEPEGTVEASPRPRSPEEAAATAMQEPVDDASSSSAAIVGGASEDTTENQPKNDEEEATSDAGEETEGNKEDEDTIQSQQFEPLIRIGEVEIERGNSDISKYYIIVATEEDEVVKYHQMTAYFVNNSLIGDYDNQIIKTADEICGLDNIKPDRLFKKAHKGGTLDQKVSRIASQLAQGVKFGHLRDAPCRPEPAGDDETFVSTQNPLKPLKRTPKEPVFINAVVVITNESKRLADMKLQWDGNIQANLRLEESFTSMLSFVKSQLPVRIKGDQEQTLTDILNEAEHTNWGCRALGASARWRRQAVMAQDRASMDGRF